MIHRRAFPNLRAYLHQTGTTKRALAKRLGVHPSYISKIAHGKKTPSLTFAGLLADEINIPIESLLKQQS